MTFDKYRKCQKCFWKWAFNKVENVGKVWGVRYQQFQLKIKMPFYCSLFQLAKIVKVDILELVYKYKETINQDISNIYQRTT